MIIYKLTEKEIAQADEYGGRKYVVVNRPYGGRKLLAIVWVDNNEVYDYIFVSDERLVDLAVRRLLGFMDKRMAESSLPR